MRGGHIRCSLVEPGGARIGAIAWRAADGPLGRRLMGGGATLHVVGKLRANAWNGRETVEMEIEDMADPRQI